MKHKVMKILLITGAALTAYTYGVMAQEVPQGVYVAAENHVKRYIHNIESFSARGMIEYADTTMLERAELGTAIRVFHKIELNQIFASNPAELLVRGVLVEYEVPVIIDGVPWECLIIQPNPDHDGEWRCIGSREADGTYLCHETVTVDDTVTLIEIDYFIFRDGGPPVVRVALVKLNDTYYLAPLNYPAAHALCGSDCDPRSLPLIEYCEAVEFNEQNRE